MQKNGENKNILKSYQANKLRVCEKLFYFVLKLIFINILLATHETLPRDGLDLILQDGNGASTQPWTYYHITTNLQDFGLEVQMFVCVYHTCYNFNGLLKDFQKTSKGLRRTFEGLLIWIMQSVVCWCIQDIHH